MSNIISLTDRLKQKIEGPKYEEGFPIFKGKVLSVDGVISSRNGTIYTSLHYVPEGLEEPQPNSLVMIAGICGNADPDSGVSLVTREAVADYERELESVVRKALVPFPVTPNMLNKAEVNAYMDNMEGCAVYVFEITKSALGSGTNYDGFKFIVER